MATGFYRKLTMLRPLSLLLLFPLLQGCSGRGGARLLWKAPIASQVTPIVTNGTVYVKGFHAGHPEEPVRVFALDAETGKERWASAEAIKEIYGESAGYLFCKNTDDHLVQLDARTGAKHYESSGGRLGIRSWAIRGDVMYITNASQEVAAVDNRQNKTLWKKKLPFKTNDDTALLLNGEQVIVSGNFRNTEAQFGMVWALDATTGHENWHFEAPPPHDYAPLEVMAHDGYVLASNTAPTVLQTYVLDAHTGKELYAPLGIFDLYGCFGNTVYAPSGAYDLHTGQKTGGKAEWMGHSIVHNGIAWKHRTTTVGTVTALGLRTVYDGDVQGTRQWTNTPPNSSLEGLDQASGKSLFQTLEFKYTDFSNPVEANGVLYHSSIAMMKEGASGVWAYRLP